MTNRVLGCLIAVTFNIMLIILKSEKYILFRVTTQKICIFINTCI